MGRKKSLSSSNETAICEKFKYGSTIAELMAEYQVSRNTVKNYLIKVGLWEKKNSSKIDLNDEKALALLSSDKSATELSKELGCSLDTIRRARLKLEGKKDVPKTKRVHVAEREVKGGIQIEKKYQISNVEYEGKKYLDITDVINNLNEIL